MSNFNCPFCGNDLATRFSKCFNVYCRGQQFNIGNLVLQRFGNLGMGRIIKRIEIPVSKSLEKEDTSFIFKFKVLFSNNIVKILPPIDLVHYIFSVNEEISIKNGVGVINSKDLLSKKGNISYEVMLPNGKLTQIEESEIISNFIPQPWDLISLGDMNPPQNFLIKYWANLFHSYYTSHQIKCITNSRLSLLPHQINVAYRLSEDYFPNVIMADEVGLGKTIEAGIYIKEMMARNLADRVIIIVPATLIHQWKFEMENKFNMKFVIYDGKKIKELKRKGKRKLSILFKNPFYHDNLIICSLQFARNPKYVELLSQISWDITIFDEAHHLRRYLLNASTGNYRETLNYYLGRRLSRSCQSLLLLTATPLQLHSFELYSLIELVHPEAFENFSDFEHFRKNMPFINLLIKNVRDIDKLNTFEVKNTIKLLKQLKHVDNTKNEGQILRDIKINSYRDVLLRKMEADHTLSNFLIRNRKKNVFPKEFLNKRVVNTIMVQPTKQEIDIYNRIRLFLAEIYQVSINKKKKIGLGFVITILQKLLTSSKYAILKSLERRLDQIERLKTINKQKKKIEDLLDFQEFHQEDEILDSELNEKTDSSLITTLNQEKLLREFVTELSKIPYDSKSQKLLDLLNQIHTKNQQEKILIFVQFVDSLLFLKKELEKKGYHVETFYGGLDKQEKDQNVEKFRQSNKFAILLSTEIGGEGRNFQFCRTLINFDLPWNPMKLEQRIGRLDRIGQEAKEIFIYNFFIDGTIETDIIFALNKRINLFEESIGILQPIIGKISADMKELIFTGSDTKKRKKMNEFYRTLDDQVKKAREIESQLEDLMIDKKSFQMDGLLGSFASCKELKLNHDELFLLFKYFFSLNKNQFGNMDKIEELGELQKEKENELNLNNFQAKIRLNENLTKNPKYMFSEEYIGTFNLDLAKEREEIDFFALGHPMINDIIEYCISEEFRGYSTILNVKKEFLPNLNYNKDIYLFVFKTKFQGFIIEDHISAVVLDGNGKEIEYLADRMLKIENYSKIFQFNPRLYEKTTEEQLDSGKIEKLKKSAENIVKLKLVDWNEDMKMLNKKIFKTEKRKKEKLYSYSRKILNNRITLIKQKLEKKKKARPTERQLKNISLIEDLAKKEEKLLKIQQLKEEIKIMNDNIISSKKKLDDLAFEHEDMRNNMIKRNLVKTYTNLMSFAVIKSVDDS